MVMPSGAMSSTSVARVNPNCSLIKLLPTVLVRTPSDEDASMADVAAYISLGARSDPWKHFELEPRQD
jgi:hypothetical protein